MAGYAVVGNEIFTDGDRNKLAGTGSSHKDAEREAIAMATPRKTSLSGTGTTLHGFMTLEFAGAADYVEVDTGEEVKARAFSDEVNHDGRTFQSGDFAVSFSNGDRTAMTAEEFGDRFIEVEDKPSPKKSKSKKSKSAEPSGDES